MIVATVVHRWVDGNRNEQSEQVYQLVTDADYSPDLVDDLAARVVAMGRVDGMDDEDEDDEDGHTSTGMMVSHDGPGDEPSSSHPTTPMDFWEWLKRGAGGNQ